MQFFRAMEQTMQTTKSLLDLIVARFPLGEFKDFKGSHALTLHQGNLAVSFWLPTSTGLSAFVSVADSEELRKPLEDFLDEVTKHVLEQKDEYEKGVAVQKSYVPTYGMTGTIAHGRAVITSVGLKVNARDVIHEDEYITYEQVVAYVDPGFFVKYPDSDPTKRPTFTVVYSHKVPWSLLHGERTGSLTPGQKVRCTGGMIIDAIITGNA